MSLRTLFFAPGTRTAPSSLAPPTTLNASTGSDGRGRREVSRLRPVVNLTRIYTRTGDDGTTSLGDFSRTSKNDPRLIAYADVDEANAAIGIAVACGALP